MYGGRGGELWEGGQLGSERLARLLAGEVQVWRLDVGGDVSLDAPLRWLNAEEQERAGRFKHEGARAHFVGGRAALRYLLGSMRGLEPISLKLEANEFGKLACAGGPEFNVAHSGGVVLIALAAAGLVGVDVEQVDPSADIAMVAERMFTSGEVTAMAGDREAFFQIWTLKEALMKADGRGLSLSSQSFEVPVHLAHGMASEASIPVDGQSFHVRGLPVGGGYAGAVATQIPARVRLLRFPFEWLMGAA